MNGRSNKGGRPRLGTDLSLRLQLVITAEDLAAIEATKRGEEIADWLRRNPAVTKYAIVDDDSDMLPDQMERFVKTSFEGGLLDEHADRLIELLRS